MERREVVDELEVDPALAGRMRMSWQDSDLGGAPDGLCLDGGGCGWDRLPAGPAER